MPPDIMQLIQGLMGGGGGQPQGPPGGAPPNFQAQLPAPQNPGMGQLNPDIMQMIQSVLTSMPDRPNPGAAPSGGGLGVPAMARQLSPQEDIMDMMIGLLQQGQPVSNAQSGLQGAQGGPFGGLGGRPVGS